MYRPFWPIRENHVGGSNVVVQVVVNNNNKTDYKCISLDLSQ